jgi:phage FluMu gp28-like protein
VTIAGKILMAALSLNFFLPYQKAWIKDETRTSIAEKSRRIGFTYAEAYRSVERRVKFGTDHIFASRTKETAGEFLEYCKMFAKVFGAVAEDIGEQPIVPKGKVMAMTIRFANGARILALSSNPDAFRGFGGDVTLDEFAYHKKQRAVLKAANATAKIWGHTVRIISTHNGEGSLFNKLIIEYRAGKRDQTKWSLHSVTLQQAVDEGLVGKILGPDKDTAEARAEFIADVRNDCIDETEWAEEYCCIPNMDATAYLNYELIDAARTPNLKLIEDPDLLTGNVVAGYDVSRRHDLCVLWGAEIVGDVYWTRMLRPLAGEDRKFSNQEKLLRRTLENRHVRRLCIDQTGMGEMLAEYMVDRYKARAEGVILSGPRKAAIATPFKGLFEDKRIRIPDDDDVREDLHKTRKVITAGGNVRLSAESDDAGHADRFWAGALMREAADEQKVQMTSHAEKPAGW